MKRKIKKPEKPQPWKKPREGMPKWIRAIPGTGSHGSGTLQKRLWRLTSDFVRIRDYYAYRGSCVATGVLIKRWQDGQAGHFLSYSVCRGLFKFDTRNIHLQSARSNSWGRREDWQQYECTLIKRYGIQYINDLEDENRASPLKFTDEQIVERMKELIVSMLDLKEKPKYLDYVVELMGNEKL